MPTATQRADMCRVAGNGRESQTEEGAGSGRLLSAALENTVKGHPTICAVFELCIGAWWTRSCRGWRCQTNQLSRCQSQRRPLDVYTAPPVARNVFSSTFGSTHSASSCGMSHQNKRSKGFLWLLQQQLHQRAPVDGPVTPAAAATVALASMVGHTAPALALWQLSAPKPVCRWKWVPS